VATSRGVQEYEYFDSSDIEFEYLRKIYSLGPSPFRIGTFQHWDKLIADVSKSKEIGWVYDNDLYGVIYQKLTIARQSAYDGDLTTVNQKLADIIQAIQNSTQAQRKDEFYYLVYYNADSLKENLPWPCEPKMTATPDYGKHALGELHQIEATLFNQANGQPIDNELLTMEVLEGPHLGTIQEVLTDAQGKATLGYIGYAEGIDEIQIRTKQGTFAGKKDKNGQTGRPSGVETPMIKKTSEAKQTDAGGKDGAKLTKKQRKSLESDCSAWDVYSGKLFAEWEGYIDLATMLAPKASQVKPNDMLFLAATVYNFGSEASPTTNLRFYMASDPFLPDNYPDGMSRIVGAPLEVELQKASVILAKLAEEEETVIAAHAGPIRTALEALATAIDTHKGAMEVEMQTYGMLQTEKVNWLDQYKKNYRDLTRLFYKTPKKADTYFKAAAKGDKAEKEAKKEGAPVAAKV